MVISSVGMGKFFGKIQRIPLGFPHTGSSHDRNDRQRYIFTCLYSFHCVVHGVSPWHSEHCVFIYLAVQIIGGHFAQLLQDQSIIGLLRYDHADILQTELLHQFLFQHCIPVPWFFDGNLHDPKLSGLFQHPGNLGTRGKKALSDLILCHFRIII